jgi:hypothetical protein
LLRRHELIAIVGAAAAVPLAAGAEKAPVTIPPSLLLRADEVIE